LYVGSAAAAVLFGLSGLPLAVLIGVGASLPLYAAEQTFSAHLQQTLAFRRLAVARCAGTTLGVVGTFGLLVLGHPVAALITRAPFGTLMQTISMWGVAGWTPRARFRRDVGRRVLRYARSLAVFNAVNQVSRKGDDVIVGAVVDAHALGLYSVAYRFIEVPVIQVNQAAQSVTFPALMRLSDNGRARAAFLRSLRLLVWLVAPVSIACVALGDVAVPAFLGAEWTQAGPIVQIFGVIVYLQVIATQSGVIFFYKGESDRMMRWGIIAVTVTLVSFLIGAHWDALGVAWGYLAANLVLTYPLWRIVGRLIGLQPHVLAQNLLGVTAAAVACVIGLTLFRTVVEVHSLLSVCAAAVGSALCFWSVTLLGDRGLRSDALSLIPRRPVASQD
jgi:O-antigen/teichoic acid export membrane protein